MQLPDDLGDALEGVLSSVHPRQLNSAVQELSDRYRAGPSRASVPLLHSQFDVMAYAAYRLPATYGALAGVLSQVARARPDFRPRSLLDVGSGPGTAAWAVSILWPDIERMALLERDRHMIELGRTLASACHRPALRSAQWRHADALTVGNADRADLVVASYVLGEMSEVERRELVGRLWTICEDVLVLIEPGTPAGYGIVLEAREALLGSDALTLAPCPHDDACPLANDWCHFSQRIARTGLHRGAKGAVLSYEDEKFSYVALSRTRGRPIAGRVVRHPQARSGHVYLDLCTPDGLERRIVSRRDRDAFRQARDLRWGAALDPSLQEQPE